MIILGIACISASAIAQPAVRIGNMEIIVRKQGQDTTMQVNVLEDPCPPCPPSENETGSRARSNTYKYHYKSSFGGLGFILPDIGSNNYTTLGGSSINLDIGSMHRYQRTRWFALVGTLHYSYYNYKLHDAAEDEDFKREALRSDYSNAEINKQVFRSHNAGIGAFTRFYSGQPRRHSNDGVFIDIGIQGDWAFSKYYKLKTHKGSKEKIRDDYAFNSFAASYVVRVGMTRWFSVYARYRFTDAFNSKALPLDLPPFTFGVLLL